MAADRSIPHDPRGDKIAEFISIAKTLPIERLLALLLYSQERFFDSTQGGPMNVKANMKYPYLDQLAWIIGAAHPNGTDEKVMVIEPGGNAVAMRAHEVIDHVKQFPDRVQREVQVMLRSDWLDEQRREQM